jgi:Bacterial regulatory protein, arsR family
MIANNRLTKAQVDLILKSEKERVVSALQTGEKSHRDLQEITGLSNPKVSRALNTLEDEFRLQIVGLRGKRMYSLKETTLPSPIDTFGTKQQFQEPTLRRGGTSSCTTPESPVEHLSSSVNPKNGVVSED